MTQDCPLCQSKASIYASNRITSFYLCPLCFGVSAAKEKRLDEQQEKERYESHDNRIDDERYLNFLRKLTQPLNRYLSKGQIGLDFGCGPVKAMESLFSDSNTVHSYDYFFYPDHALLEKKYDFVIASEVVEHLYYPDVTFAKFQQMLGENGLLAIMTQAWHEQLDFGKWWYAMDPTHVFFYHQKTFEYLAQKFGFRLLEKSESVFLLQKS